jgi:hypothetical protein
MDANRFDVLSRQLSTLDTRRGLLRLLTALPLAGALAAIRGAEEAAAERPLDRVQRRTPQRNRKQRNNNNNQRNRKQGGQQQNDGGKGKGSGRCQNMAKCQDGTCCDLSQCQDCIGGTCVKLCTTGQRCDRDHGRCVCDGQSCPNGCCQGAACKVNDATACGIGGGTCVACGSGETCCGGQCCGGATGKTCCGNTCVDLRTDPANCGGCDRNCREFSNKTVCCPTGDAFQGDCCDHCCGSGAAQGCCEANETICCGADGSVCCPGPSCCGIACC